MIWLIEDLRRFGDLIFEEKWKLNEKDGWVWNSKGLMISMIDREGAKNFFTIERWKNYEIGK